MRGVVFLGERQLELREFPDPTPGPGEVILQMKASGMCGSDLHVYRASRQGSAARNLGLGGTGGPVIGGHEPSGVVLDRGPGVAEADAPTGQRVMQHHYKGCGQCVHCRGGWSQLCRQGIVVYGITGHGGHAPFMKAPASTLVPLRDELTFEEGAAIACGTGTAYQALKRLDVSGRDTLAIFGQGPVGLSGLLLGQAMGARVLVVDPAPERQQLAHDFGAEAVLDPAGDDVVSALKQLTHGEGVDAALDCSGQAEGRLAAIRATRTWGRVGLVGEGGSVTIDVSPDLLRRQLTLHASWTFSTLLQAECARFVIDRKVPLARLLTERYRLDQAHEAYRRFDTQTTGKGVFVF